MDHPFRLPYGDKQTKSLMQKYFKTANDTAIAYLLASMLKMNPLLAYAQKVYLFAAL